jgi:hypothetical protein
MPDFQNALNKKSALETKALYPEPNKPVNYLPHLTTGLGLKFTGGTGFFQG